MYSDCKENALNSRMSYFTDNKNEAQKCSITFLPKVIQLLYVVAKLGLEPKITKSKTGVSFNIMP